jgi:hypothetical protein
MLQTIKYIALHQLNLNINLDEDDTIVNHIGNNYYEFFDDNCLGWYNDTTDEMVIQYENHDVDIIAFTGYIISPEMLYTVNDRLDAIDISTVSTYIRMVDEKGNLGKCVNTTNYDLNEMFFDDFPELLNS